MSFHRNWCRRCERWFTCRNRHSRLCLDCLGSHLRRVPTEESVYENGNAWLWAAIVSDAALDKADAALGEDASS
jgi:hypothetical protein